MARRSGESPGAKNEYGAAVALWWSVERESIGGRESSERRRTAVLLANQSTVLSAVFPLSRFPLTVVYTLLQRYCLLSGLSVEPWLFVCLISYENIR